MAGALIIGLVVGLARIGNYRGKRLVRPFLIAYVDTLRGLPTIVTLFILYFGLPSVGVTISNQPIVVGIVGLSLMLGAYLSEVFRAAIMAVDSGQTEAALSIGMARWQAFVRIVLPQALLIAVPTLGGYFIGLIKDSSLVGFISVVELLRTGNLIVAATFRPFEVYLIIGAIYLILSLVASRVVILIERRLRPREKSYRHLKLDELSVTGVGGNPLMDELL
jgi:His/Glu/Gln/Arg/opine family amino acid ABC transporter permease subunit